MKEKSEFSLDDLIPSEEVASGMHTPVGENMFSVPNKADDSKKIDKKALGLTSIPQSLYGGEVLEFQGSPEPPGLSQEVGDEEYTEFFGAKESEVDFPPEHKKNQKKVLFQNQIDKDKPTEDFFDFLSFNKKNYLNEDKMFNYLDELEKGLKKIKAVNPNYSFNKKIALDKKEQDLRAVWGELTMAVGDLQSHVLKNTSSLKDIPEGATNRYEELVRNRIFGKQGSQMEDVKNISTLRSELESYFPQLFGFQWEKRLWNVSQYKEKIEKIVEAAKAFNAHYFYFKKFNVNSESNSVSRDEIEKWYKENYLEYYVNKENSGKTETTSKPGVTPKATSNSGWKGYTDRGGSKEMEAAWNKYILENQDMGFDDSFESWVKWYRKQVSDGTIPAGNNVKEVLNLLNSKSISEESGANKQETPPGTRTEEPIAKPAEKDTPISEERKEVSLEDALYNLIALIYNDVLKLKDPEKAARARRITRRLKRKVRRTLRRLNTTSFEPLVEALINSGNRGELEQLYSKHGTYEEGDEDLTLFDTYALNRLTNLNLNRAGIVRDRTEASDLRIKKLIKM